MEYCINLFEKGKNSVVNQYLKLCEEKNIKRSISVICLLKVSIERIKAYIHVSNIVYYIFNISDVFLWL